MLVIISKAQVVTYSDNSTATLVTMKDAKVGKLGGPGRSIYTIFNGSIDEAKASIDTKEEFEIRDERIVEGKPYEKNGKTIKSLWYKL
jgi:hypothetical protein